jgi:ribosomal-protein-alanine N-acetyltransferase
MDTEGGKRLTVQLIEKNDENIEALIRIDREAFKDPLFNNWVLPPFIRYGRAYGLIDNGSMIGFALFLRSWSELDVAYMEAIAIDREHQGRGYSRYLLSESLRRLKDDRISYVVLTVDPKNIRALHIYQDLFGFRLVEHRKDEYGKGKDRFLLKLDLDEWSDRDR